MLFRPWSLNTVYRILLTESATDWEGLSYPQDLGNTMTQRKMDSQLMQSSIPWLYRGGWPAWFSSAHQFDHCAMGGQDVSTFSWLTGTQTIQAELLTLQCRERRNHNLVTPACLSSRFLKMHIQWLWTCWLTVFLLFSFFFSLIYLLGFSFYFFLFIWLFLFLLSAFFLLPPFNYFSPCIIVVLCFSKFSIWKQNKHWLAFFFQRRFWMR